ncbi:MAG: GDP-L-fucose synthase [Armatimonadetes bacterium]|nr:GDP-L-fucose synthase [Armatimonadota bacterium]
MPALKTGNRVYLAGHRGLVGSAILRALEEQERFEIVTRTHQELDLLNQRDTYSFLAEVEPDTVIVAAAKVGGIHANNSQPAEFISQNLIIQSNLIEGSHRADVQNLLFLGSSCIYPREAPQPMPEAALLTGPPEPTNAAYAVAKIAGLYLCDAISKQYGRNYFTVMPPNVFGPGDSFHPEHSHVIAALIRRFHEHLPNKTVTCWGTGSPKREFLHSDELADACLFMLGREKVEGHVNVGTGTSITISELAETIQRITGHTGEIEWDTSMPDGFPEKTLDVSRLRCMGWQAKRPFEDGLREAYEWFKANVSE